MDFPDTTDLSTALELAEAEHRLAAAQTPDRLCEDWRFGRPHEYAAQLVALMEGADNRGTVTIEGAEDAADSPDREDRAEEQLLHTIGSDKILAQHLAHFGKGAVLFLEKEYTQPITITYETDGVFLPTTLILAAPGAKAHIIEKHITRGAGAIVCTRLIHAEGGADIAVELHESGSGESRAMNITNIRAVAAKVRHLTLHENHAWAREETVADILQSSEEQPADVQLYSANRLAGTQVLDQHTRQIHSCGQAYSNLLYKNVVDDNATATFAGNIFVAPGAHNTDAYQANRNMLLSEKATVNSLPGLEILADKVRCSHGSASAPMDEEQLFYLLSRGIPRHEAQLLVADGFLADAVTHFEARD